jgi:hypothetical protein
MISLDLGASVSSGIHRSTRTGFAIADCAEIGWPERARNAAVALTTGELREEESRGLILLRDTRRVIVESQLDRITTSELIRRVAEDEESPSADWWDRRDCTPASGAHRQLARLLKRYRISSRTLRFGSQQAKGFDQADFRDAWARYLPQGDGAAP